MTETLYEHAGTALHRYLDFGTEVARVNSHAREDSELHDCQVVPRWDRTSR